MNLGSNLILLFKKKQNRHAPVIRSVPALLIRKRIVPIRFPDGRNHRLRYCPNRFHRFWGFRTFGYLLRSTSPRNKPPGIKMILRWRKTIGIYSLFRILALAAESWTERPEITQLHRQMFSRFHRSHRSDHRSPFSLHHAVPSPLLVTWSQRAG